MGRERDFGEQVFDANAGATSTLRVVAGAGSGALTGFEHVQSSASATWTINHNLGRNVGTDVFTVGGVKIIAEVVNISINQTQVLLDTAAAGYAILN